MTTSAADRDLIRELDARMALAWEDYRASTRELDGPAYEEAESLSWDRLQQALHELADERERLVGAASVAD
jgi:hypothetical protein